jgi:oligoribonuclease
MSYPKPPSDVYVWIDLEMTGIDPVNDKIMEIATIITDYNLNIIAECNTIIIHLDQHELDNMGEWCIEQHGKSGLSKSVLESTTSLQEAEGRVFDFIREFVPKSVGIIAGNSVHMDKEFLRYHMPRIFDHLSYKILDVSTLKLLTKNWYPKLPNFNKSYSHRALDDIKESIQELNYYRIHFLHN